MVEWISQAIGTEGRSRTDDGVLKDAKTVGNERLNET